MNYWDTFLNGYTSYANYLWREIAHPGWHNYFYWLLIVSVFFFVVEQVNPWRKGQARFRKDFWLDFFYMFFNFFLFSLIIYNAASDVIVQLFNDAIRGVFHFDLQAMNPMRLWPAWAILLTGFVVRDFIQWWVHRLLHRSSWLWEFHKVHHSVEQMGFAAHLRYHWMENVVYRTLEYIPLALMGIGLHDFFIIHIFALSIGHYNHSNITVSGQVTGGILGGLIGIVIGYGLLDTHIPLTLPIHPVLIVALGVMLGYFILGRFMKYIFNHPEMHIWHHAHDLPEEKRYGVNFGLSLAIWDFLFKTAYIPFSGRDIRLGFPGVTKYPATFFRQNLHGFSFFNKKK